MERLISWSGRLTALLLAVVLAVSLVPVRASAAGSAHFADVSASHWAYPYVERAYQDGAIAGTGGDPARGTGVFDPDARMTYGQLLTMLMSAFYPDELAQARQANDPWYAPAMRVALNHELTYISQERLLELNNSAINRYNAAWIISKLLGDQGVTVSKTEREQAAARIGDWSTVTAAANGAWNTCVSTVFSAGIISGVDDKGTFNGNGSITRGVAAVIYTKLADKLQSGQSTSQSSAAARQEFGLVYGSNWGLITAPGYKEEVEAVFYEVYPRLWARWSGGNVTKTVPIDAKAELKNASTSGAIMWTGRTWDKGGFWSPYIEVSAKLQYDYPGNYSTAHELVHVVQANYPTSQKYKYSWWDECMADYGRFRYYAWADADHLTGRHYYQADQDCLRDWHFEAYGDSLWFFAYMDSKYPTTPQGYGLIDSIHYAIIAGQVSSDSPSDPSFNAVVQRVTGYSTIEQLRQQYVRELDAGTWTFNGFGGYADNYITENIPGVPNPTYPTGENFNLCNGAYTYAVSGEASSKTAADYLVDGDLSTKWQAAREDSENKAGAEVSHDLCISLEKPVTFDSYTLYHAGSQGDSQHNTVSWRLRYHDRKTDQWKDLDLVQGNTQDVTTRNVKQVTAQHLWLQILNPSASGDGTVRLYEMELYDN